MDTREAILARIAALVADVTGADATTLTARSSAGNTSGWDSIANITLIELIEEELGVVIGTADAIRLSSLGELFSGDRRLTDVGDAFTAAREIPSAERFTAVSTNGTEVNGQPIRRRRLANGDLLKLASSTLQFRREG